MLFLFSFVCIIPFENLSKKPHLMALGDLLVLSRMMIPDKGVPAAGIASFAIGVLLLVLTAPTLKKDFIKFQQDMSRAAQDRSDWEKKNGIS